MKLDWWPWRREQPERTEDESSGMSTWTWTGPTEEGPPMVGIGRTRWDAEQAVIECVERFDALLGNRYGAAEGASVGLFDRLEWARHLQLVTDEEVEIWRAALQIRSTILADDKHDVPMDILRVRTTAVNGMCDVVADRIDRYLMQGPANDRQE